MIKETEDSFTTYLTVKQYQWASETYREMFIKQLTDVTDPYILKETLKTLQESFLFAEYVPEVSKKRMD